VKHFNGWQVTVAKKTETKASDVKSELNKTDKINLWSQEKIKALNKTNTRKH